MKAAKFDYVRPTSVEEALATLARADGAKLIAGGQSLGPMLNLRLARPELLIDIARLDVLRQIGDRGDVWRIGAAVTHAELEDAVGRLTGAAMLCVVAAGIAYRAIRNRGTIGGSLVHADPAADWPVALAALGASILVRNRHAERRIMAERFIQGAFTTVMAADEIITAIEVPKLSAAGRYGYYKFCRKTGEFAEAIAAALFEPERRTASIILGALTGAPVALSPLAQRLAEQGSSALTKEAVTTAVAEAAPTLDRVGRRMGTAAVMRALQQVFNP